MAIDRKESKKAPLRIAIVKLSAMGDIIHALIAVQFLKEAYQNIKIDWLVEECFAGILENNPHISNILTINLRGVKKKKSNIFTEIRKLLQYRRNNYDLVIDAQGLLKSAICARIIGKKIVGFNKNSIREKVASLFYNEHINIPLDKYAIERNLAVICTPFNLKINKQIILNKKPFLFYQNENNIIYDYLSKNKRNIIFVVGSTWESKNYPKEGFLKIANMLQENIIVIWGNEEERTRAQWLESNCKYIKAATKLDLNSLKGLIANADLLIGNDTGPTFMAWGLNIPCIIIHGPTLTNKIYPTDQIRFITSDTKINPFKLNKKDFSIRTVDENLILKEAKSLLESIAAPISSKY
jgi:heptosyltransferase I